MHFSDKSTFLGAGLKMSLWGLCISSVSFAANPPAHELAKINGAVISTADFEAKYKESLRFFRFKAPTRKNVLDEMVNRELAIQEAKKLGIPLIGVVDTNHSPEGINYVIPGNDDSAKAVELYARALEDAVIEGRNSGGEEVVKGAGAEGNTTDEFVEVQEPAAV